MIYFLQEDNTLNIKIGVTRTPLTLLKRIKQANTLNGCFVRVIGITDGMFREESTLKDLFDEFNRKYIDENIIKEEWFNPADNLLEYIDAARKESIYQDCIIQAPELIKYIKRESEWN